MTASKANASKMRERAKSLVPPEHWKDFLSFIETGDTTESFLRLLDGNSDCQAAVELYIDADKIEFEKALAPKPKRGRLTATSAIASAICVAGIALIGAMSVYDRVTNSNANAPNARLDEAKNRADEKEALLAVATRALETATGQVNAKEKEIEDLQQRVKAGKLREMSVANELKQSKENEHKATEKLRESMNRENQTHSKLVESEGREKKLGEDLKLSKVSEQKAIEDLKTAHASEKKAIDELKLKTEQFADREKILNDEIVAGKQELDAAKKRCNELQILVLLSIDQHTLVSKDAKIETAVKLFSFPSAYTRYKASLLNPKEYPDGIDGLRKATLTDDPFRHFAEIELELADKEKEKEPATKWLTEAVRIQQAIDAPKSTVREHALLFRSLLTEVAVRHWANSDARGRLEPTLLSWLRPHDSDMFSPVAKARYEIAVKVFSAVGAAVSKETKDVFRDPKFRYRFPGLEEPTDFATLRITGENLARPK